MILKQCVNETWSIVIIQDSVQSVAADNDMIMTRNQQISIGRHLTTANWGIFLFKILHKNSLVGQSLWDRR